MNRYYFNRMTPAELSEALNALEMTVGDLMWITGVTRMTAEMWLDPEGKDPREASIPHWIAILVELLRNPQNFEIALDVSDRQSNSGARRERQKEVEAR